MTARTRAALRNRFAVRLFVLLLFQGGVAVVPAAASSGTLRAEELTGIWSASMATRALFDLCIHVTRRADSLSAVLQSSGRSEHLQVWVDGDRLRWQSKRCPLSFNGAFDVDGNLEGFLKHASTSEHLVLRSGGCPVHDEVGDSWSVAWSALGTLGGPLPIDLYVEREESTVAGYLFFRQPTLPGLWTYGFTVANDVVSFRDRNLGMEFRGSVNATRDSMSLQVVAFGNTAGIVFTRTDTAPDRQGVPRNGVAGPWRDRAPEKTGDGWSTGTAAGAGLETGRLAAMFDAIVRSELVGTHSVLIARGGTLVFEEYFYGYDRDRLHDTRSASKTVAAALVGAAIDHGHLPRVEVPVLSLLPQYREFDHWDARKARITVEDCLRMASGLDADDYGKDAVAAEWRYQSQTQQPDWVKFVLDAPMVADPGARSVYGGANPLLVGGVLQSVLSEPLELFLHRALFAPLGVQHYRLFLDPLDNVYLGGGMHLRPRDLAKFGQMHLDGGRWSGRTVLDAAYVAQAMSVHGHLTNVPDKNDYGYLWWHRDYDVEGRSVHSIEARGAGGQYVCVLPELQIVAVITSGNYRNGLFRQPETILQKFIVPAALGHQ